MAENLKNHRTCNLVPANYKFASFLESKCSEAGQFFYTLDQNLNYYLKMKKQLLIGSALFAAMSAFPQTGRVSGGSAGVANHKAEKVSATAGVNEDLLSPMPGSGIMTPVENEAQPMSKAATTVNWGLLTGSSNCYGQLVSSSRPLSYNPELNAVSFIHRKSDYYTESPALPSTAKTGVIVANVSTNWGATWDSTAIWANATNWGRYPQGGIYNPTGNTSISNAYVIGTGPTVANTTWSGNYYTSKKLNTFDATASTAPGAQYFFDLALASYPAGQFSHGWTRNGFTSTLDGKVHAIGVTESDLQGLSTVTGFAVLTGTFNPTSNTFDWSMENLLPPCIVDGAGDKNLNPDPQMVWNRAGTVGYIVGIGALQTGTLATRGMQPIIYKYDASAGATWTLQSGIDFNATNMRRCIISKYESKFGMGGFHILANGDTVGVPFFNDYDCTVDANNNLHIGATFYSSASDHPDSLSFLQTFTTTINPTERYSWRMVNGSRPYLWDFYGDGSNFTPILVDSIASEGPSAASGQRGYNENPWDPSGTGSAKVNMDSRIQLGSTADGKHVVITWVESDSLFTNQQLKWNSLPDLKTRAIAVVSGTNNSAYKLDIGTSTNSTVIGNEQNLTASDNNVRTRATLHYMSNVCSNGTVSASNANNYPVDIMIPLSVTNSNPYSQLTNNATWFGAAKVTYRFPQTPFNDVAVGEINGVISATSIYPNPAQGAAAVKFALASSSQVEVVVMNAVGQVVKSVKVQGNAGENAVRIDLSGIASGIYMVNVKAGDSQTTKKLIVE